MTENLKTLLDRAADADFAAPDLDFIARAGDRAVRRRRVGLGAAAVAALAVVGGGVVVVAGGDDTGAVDRVPVAGGTAPVDTVTWTLDGALHTVDGASYDLGHPVAAYVRTSVGYAFTDGEGAVFSYVDGFVEEVGSTTGDRPRLVADTEGSLVGWVDGSGDSREFVVHDLATGETTTFGSVASGMGSLPDEADPFFFYALDGRTAYVRDSRGAVAVDVDSGDVRVVEADARNGFDIKGVEDGVIAFDASETKGAGTVVGTSPTEGVGLEPGWGSPAVFSPDGRWVSLEGDEPDVYDASTGRPVAIDIGGRPFGTGYEWLDEDTLALVAAPTMKGPLQILSCDVPAGTCSVVVEDLGPFEEIEGELAIPVGEPVG